MHIQYGQAQKSLCPFLFSANSSLRVFSKTWQYYFIAKRRFALVQSVSKTGPKCQEHKTIDIQAEFSNKLIGIFQNVILRTILGHHSISNIKKCLMMQN